MPKAARIGDLHTCPMSDGPKPHVGGAILSPGVPNVLIEGKPAAVATDFAECKSPAPDQIAQGCGTVLIGFRNAARVGDLSVHNGPITIGAATVEIGVKGDAKTVLKIRSKSRSSEDKEPKQDKSQKKDDRKDADDGKKNDGANKDTSKCCAQAIAVNVTRRNRKSVSRKLPATAARKSGPESPVHLIVDDGGSAQVELTMSKPLCSDHGEAIRITGPSGTTNASGVATHFDVDSPSFNDIGWLDLFGRDSAFSPTTYTVGSLTCSSEPGLGEITINAYPSASFEASLEVALEIEQSRSQTSPSQTPEIKKTSGIKLTGKAKRNSVTYANFEGELEHELSKTTGLLTSSYYVVNKVFGVIGKLSSGKATLQPIKLDIKFSYETEEEEDCVAPVGFKKTLQLSLSAGVAISIDIVDVLLIILPAGKLIDLIRKIIKAIKEAGPVSPTGKTENKCEIILKVTGSVAVDLPKVEWSTYKPTTVSLDAMLILEISLKADLRFKGEYFIIAYNVGASAELKVGGGLGFGLQFEGSHGSVAAVGKLDQADFVVTGSAGAGLAGEVYEENEGTVTNTPELELYRYVFWEDAEERLPIWKF